MANQTTLSNATVELIRAKIIQNTKHLTHNTEHQTQNILLNSQELGDVEIPAEASGIASHTSGEAICSGEVNCGLVNDKIEYLAISVKTPNPSKPQRLDVNVDFTTGNSQFNKLTFDLVCYDRKREFMANIQDREYANWFGYIKALDKLSNIENGFIGKGRSRGAYTANRSRKRTPVIPETAMVIDPKEKTCHLWIEDAFISLPLNEWSDNKNIFYYKGEYIKQGVAKSWKRGGWL